MTAELLRDQLKGIRAYGNRAADDIVEIGDWAISIRSLPTGVANYIDGLGDDAERRFMMVRFGIVGWSGLKNKGGADIPFTSEKFVIYGKQYDVVSRDLMDAIPFNVLELLAQCVVEQCFLTQTEQQAVDFTSPPAAEGVSQAAQGKGLTLTESVTPADGEA